METHFVCKALLFDLDGTLVNSLPAVDRAWTTFSHKHGLDPSDTLAKIHGRRSVESIRLLLPEVDAEEEDLYIRHLEATDTEGVVALPGAIAFLESLPHGRWGIVTSGARAVADARIMAAGIPRPGVVVVGDDVRVGKPAPDPFLLGAMRLGVEPADCIGFEDALPGLQSVLAAGMRAIAVNYPSHSPSIVDFTQIVATVHHDGLDIWIS